MSFLSVGIVRQKYEPPEGAARFLRCDTAGTYRVISADGSIEVELRKRSAYPVTYCEVADSEVRFGYGAYGAAESAEYLHCAVDIRGNLRIERDAFAVLPVFYVATPEGLLVANSYQAVVSRMPRTELSYAGVVESMAVEAYIARPVVDGVSWLGEREQLRYRGGELAITRAPDRPWLASDDLPPSNPKEFLKKYDAYLDYFIESRLSGQAYACEVSGGLDSATLPQYLSLRHGQRSLLSSLVLPGEDGEMQSRKLRAVMDLAGSGILLHDADLAAFPLARMLGQPSPTYFETMYMEVFAPLYDKLQQRGVKVLAQGDGADELLGHLTGADKYVYWGEDARGRRQKQQLPLYATDRFRELYVASTPSEPIHGKPWRPFSTVYGSFSKNELIKRDIWPVSPFADYGLYDYVQGLPIQYRANKNILRMYHHSYGFAPEIYDTQRNEDFDPFAALAFRSPGFRQLLERYLDGAITVQLGYVDPAGLWALYDKVQHADTESAGAAGFQLYLWLLAEINARVCSEY
ncbi:hypothetical protein CR970_00700 [Candidatus Saccharibacteria bacterium]|nr:MAG: hypothetical protein CR970_00700 [Candidatus Saccharibacteria bacterium]